MTEANYQSRPIPIPTERQTNRQDRLPVINVFYVISKQEKEALCIDQQILGVLHTDL